MTAAQAYVCPVPWCADHQPGSEFDGPLYAFHYGEPVRFEVAADETWTYARSGITARVVQHTDGDGVAYPTMTKLEVADDAYTFLAAPELRLLAAWLLERADDLARTAPSASACVCAERGYCADVVGDPLGCPVCVRLDGEAECPAAPVAAS